jgi:hypothetical protein
VESELVYQNTNEGTKDGQHAAADFSRCKHEVSF